MDQSALFKSTQTLRKQGQVEDAAALLRDAIRRGLLDPEGIEKAGRFLSRVTPEIATSPAPQVVALLGQFTTSWLVPALTALAWGRGSAVRVVEGGYDTIMQDLNGPTLDSEKPHIIVLLPWNQRLLGDSGGDPIAGELSFWKQAWDLVQDRFGSKLIQVGYDWVNPGALGLHLGGGRGGTVGLIREINMVLRDNMPKGAYFLDLEQCSSAMGRQSFYNGRRYYWTKQPFSEAGPFVLAEHLWAGVRALTTGPKKLLVLDLDNTLWGGVVGEVGPRGIALGESPDGEAFRAIQAYCKDLTRRGVLLAVCSKNNLADAREPFEINGNMILKLDDFAAFEACWEPKGVMIERIARTLNLGLDSFVFLDDNPAEREQVRQALPDVEVVEVDDDPSTYLGTLQAGLWFETTYLTDADRERAARYAVERERRELQTSCTSLDEYLISLEMVADIRLIDEDDLPRVVQLMAKTNQFNLTTRRHSTGDILDRLARPGAIGITLRLRDRFGDHGLVGVMIAVPESEGVEGKSLLVDSWLMSCRVIGRTVEHYFLNKLIDHALSHRCSCLVGEYIPTKKNAQVARLYEELGFSRATNSDSHADRFELNLETLTRPVSQIRAQHQRQGR